MRQCEGWNKSNKIDFYMDETKDNLKYYKGIKDYIIAMFDYKLWTLEPTNDSQEYHIEPVGSIRNLFFLPEMEELGELNEDLRLFKETVEQTERWSY